AKRYHFTRRMMITSLVVLITGGSAIAWLAAPRLLSQGLTATSTSQLMPRPTSAPLPTMLYTYRGHSGKLYSVAWSPDSKRIASVSHETTVSVWEAADGTHLLAYRGHTGYVLAVAWSPDGKCIASAGLDKTVQVWDAADGGHLFTYRG